MILQLAAPHSQRTKLGRSREKVSRQRLKLVVVDIPFRWDDNDNNIRRARLQRHSSQIPKVRRTVEAGTPDVAQKE